MRDPAISSSVSVHTLDVPSMNVRVVLLDSEFAFRPGERRIVDARIVGVELGSSASLLTVTGTRPGQLRGRRRAAMRVQTYGRCELLLTSLVSLLSDEG